MQERSPRPHLVGPVIAVSALIMAVLTSSAATAQSSQSVRADRQAVTIESVTFAPEHTLKRYVGADVTGTVRIVAHNNSNRPITDFSPVVNVDGVSFYVPPRDIEPNGYATFGTELVLHAPGWEFKTITATSGESTASIRHRSIPWAAVGVLAFAGYMMLIALGGTVMTLFRRPVDQFDNRGNP